MAAPRIHHGGRRAQQRALTRDRPRLQTPATLHAALRRYVLAARLLRGAPVVHDKLAPARGHLQAGGPGNCVRHRVELRGRAATPRGAAGAVSTLSLWSRQVRRPSLRDPTQLGAHAGRHHGRPLARRRGPEAGVCSARAPHHHQVSDSTLDRTSHSASAAKKAARHAAATYACCRARCSFLCALGCACWRSRNMCPYLSCATPCAIGIRLQRGRRKGTARNAHTGGVVHERHEGQQRQQPPAGNDHRRLWIRGVPPSGAACWQRRMQSQWRRCRRAHAAAPEGRVQRFVDKAAAAGEEGEEADRRHDARVRRGRQTQSTTAAAERRRSKQQGKNAASLAPPRQSSSAQSAGRGPPPGEPDPPRPVRHGGGRSHPSGGVNVTHLPQSVCRRRQSSAPERPCKGWWARLSG